MSSRRKNKNISAIDRTTTIHGTVILTSGSDISVNGIMASDVELSYLNGVTSNIRSQLNSAVDYSSKITGLKNKQLI